MNSMIGFYVFLYFVGVVFSSLILMGDDIENNNDLSYFDMFTVAILWPVFLLLNGVYLLFNRLP